MGTRQLAMDLTALRFRLKRPCLSLQLDHVIPELDRHTEMRRRGAVRVAFFHEINNPRAEFHWMRFAHVCLPVMLTNTQSQIRKIRNPETIDPASIPPRASAFKNNPTIIGEIIAKILGSIIALSDPAVLIATALAASGLTPFLPSFKLISSFCSCFC